MPSQSDHSAVKRCSQLVGGVAATLTCLPLPSTAQGILLDTSRQQSFSVLSSQVFTDFSNSPVLAFDDITVTGQGWTISKFTAFGGERRGTSTDNVGIFLDILSEPSATINPLFSFTGYEDENANLIFDLQNFWLPAGTYWFSAYVYRPFSTGDQWFWYRTQPGGPVLGSEAFVHDPNNILLRGLVNPTPVSKASALNPLPSDLSFQIEGTVVPQVVETPEPTSAIALLGAGVLGLRSRLKSKP